MVDYETRRLPMYPSGDWHSNITGLNDDGALSSSHAGTSSISSRRRSSAANMPPAAPPPSHPMPSLPASSEATLYGMYGRDESLVSPQSYDEDFVPAQSSSMAGASLNPYQRQGASAQLAAVAAFSQARLAASSISPQSTSSGNLSDSPPRSLLPRRSQPSLGSSQEIIPDRLLLSPPEPRSPSGQSRPSSRRALTRALELAKEAVRLDSTNDDPHGAIMAYGQSVALLNEVMERVMRGEDSGESRRRNGRRRSIVAQEEEVKRLKSIHDTYADRMNILSLIYSIPTTQYVSSQSGTYTRSQSPGSSSPSSDSSYHAQTRGSVGEDTDEYSTDHDGYATRTSYAVDTVHRTTSANSSPTITSAMPAYDLRNRNSAEQLNGTISQPSENAARMSTVMSSRHVSGNGTPARLRASSNLPPRPPCPSVSPPQTPPTVDYTNPPLSPRSLPPAPDGKRSRGGSVSHKRTGSGTRLEVLKEETNDSSQSLQIQQQYHFEAESELRRSQSGKGYLTPKFTSFESPPLPPVPSPSTSEPGATPRVTSSSTESSAGASSPNRNRSPALPSTRLRGSSTMSSKSDSSGSRSQQLLINDSTTMGTISQRRNRANIPQAVLEDASLSLTQHGGSKDNVNRLTASSLPMNGPSSLSIGRLRAASHPVRPSMLTTQTASQELGVRTAFPGSFAQQSFTTANRKSSGFRQSPHPPIPQPPHTASLHAPTLTLVPPPPLLMGELQTTPTSPLPPLPPPDPLRKPYHLMCLLRHTITSKSGGYITRRLHVPCEVWTQGGAYLSNLPEKIRVIDILCEALSEVQNASSEFCGPSVSNGFALGVGSVGRKEGEAWAIKLEEFSGVCDGVVGNFGKKLGVGESFIARKSTGMTSWGGRFARQLDKLTNGKNLDSPATYVQGLSRLFLLAQVLDDHTMAVNYVSLAPTYNALPPELRLTVEMKLKRASEFFAGVVLTFVVRDLSQLLDKYAKKCEKWLEE